MVQHNSNHEIKSLANNDTFSLNNKHLPYAYISSIPSELHKNYFISIHEHRKGEIKGVANGFRFYVEPYSYESARFNINDFKVDNDTFLLRIETMFSTLHYLNKKPTGALNMYIILKHILENGRYVFSVRDLFLKVRTLQYSPSLVEFKKRDYMILEELTFKRNIDFLNALNEARRIVNCDYNLKNLFDLLQERIINNDYGYLNEAIIIGHKNNNLIIYALIRKFNLLCTGLQRHPRKQDKSEPLYSNSIKSLTLKCISLKVKQQNAFMQKGIIKYERELKDLNRLVNNRFIVHQLFLILKDLSGLETDLVLTEDTNVQKLLKIEIMNLINKKKNCNISDEAAEAVEFDSIYKAKSIYYNHKIPLNNRL
nr:hypothetical protein [uncultured Flavobacterium sp.]